MEKKLIVWILLGIGSSLFASDKSFVPEIPRSHRELLMEILDTKTLRDFATVGEENPIPACENTPIIETVRIDPKDFSLPEPVESRELPGRMGILDAKLERLDRKNREELSRLATLRNWYLLLQIEANLRAEVRDNPGKLDATRLKAARERIRHVELLKAEMRAMVRSGKGIDGVFPNAQSLFAYLWKPALHGKIPRDVVMTPASWD